MNKEDGRRKTIYYMYFLPVIVWMGVIFYMSAQVGDDSSSMSDRITDAVLKLISLFSEGIYDREDMVRETVSLCVRKTAHMAEFAILFLLIYLAFLKNKIIIKDKVHTGWIVLLCTALYACTDELHQLFVPGRCGSITDVMIDTAGAMIAMLFVYVTGYVRNILKRRKKV